MQLMLKHVPCQFFYSNNSMPCKPIAGLLADSGTVMAQVRGVLHQVGADPGIRQRCAKLLARSNQPCSR